MAKLTLRVSLLSGEFVSVAAAPDTALRDLRRRAERKLARGIAALVWGARLLEATRLSGGWGLPPPLSRFFGLVGFGFKINMGGARWHPVWGCVDRQFLF